MINQEFWFLEGSEVELLEKIKNIFKEKDDKKKIENLVAFLIILVVTLIIVNKILKDDSGNNQSFVQNQTDVQLVDNSKEDFELVDNEENDNLETRLEKILSKIEGVGKTEVLITYRENETKIEGAIVIAEGAENIDVKQKIIQAVETATGLLSHKIQVFEMKKE